MMMMGLYAMKDVPFRDVYLHALVRDEKGEKMSKSKGNSIDPIEMIDKYGTDAFRFTLAAFTAQGRDVKMSEERIEGYKYFVNKIWNATRFSLMNLEDYPREGVSVGRNEESLPDRWIRHQLNRTVNEVVKNLDEYRFNEATAAVYQFVWHEFCDWYLELIKPTLYGKGDPAQRQATQQTLFTVLKNSLKLLHPFMPFVTEEIWQTLIRDGSSIMVSEFPAVDDSFQDLLAEKQMRVVMNVVTSVRNIRGEMNTAPSKKLRAVVSAPEEELRAIITTGKDHIVNLANLEALDIGGKMEEPKDAATGVIGSIRVFVLLEGMMDVAGELARLEKEMARVTKDLTFVSKKLANRDFMAKASKTVIEKEEEKFRAVKEKHVVLDAALKKLREMSAPHHA
jgi:valyl-tRNA synthetase